MHPPLPIPGNPQTPPVLATLLPGSNRKRSQSLYFYRLTYQNPDPTAVGCVMTWDVHGGRLVYQIAMERNDQGVLRCHCTCADAVYRAEEEGRFCKHIRGFLSWGKPEEDQRELGLAG